VNRHDPVNRGDKSTLYALRSARRTAAIAAVNPRNGARTALLQGATEISFKDGEGSIEHFSARHNYDIQSRLHLESRSQLVAPEQLPRQAFRAIPADGRSQFTTRSDTQSGVGASIRHEDEGHETRVESSSFRIRAFKFRTSADALAWRQAERRCHRYPSSATVKRLRPLARRRFSTIRPFLVDIRTLNPCAFFRRRVLG
jgi:hypothetical protein